jgi:hypothetical protein
MSRMGSTVQPQASTRDHYDRLFAVQTRIYPALRDVLADLARASS